MAGKPETKRDAYFLAKRQMVAGLDGRIEALQKEYNEVLYKPSSVERTSKALELQIRLSELEKMRSYVRNVLLWSAADD